MLAAIDGELAGIVAVADTVKADSQQASQLWNRVASTW